MLNTKRNNILFLSPLPPVIYGSALSSKMCLDCLRSDLDFSVNNIKLNFSKNISDVGKFGFKKLIYFLKLLIKILFLKTNQYDFIYLVPSTSGASLIRDFLVLKILKFKCKCKVILHLRSQFLVRNFNNVFWDFLIKNLLKGNRIILVGSELIPNLNGYVPASNIFIIPNGIISSLSEESYNKIKITRKNNSSLNLLFLSNMYLFKGWKIVLETALILKNSNVRFKINFAGQWTDNTSEKEFFEYVDNHGLNSFVKYVGSVSFDEKNELFSSSDVFLFPSEYKLETFGRVIIEAMEYGIPVISNNVGSVKSIIKHGITGFILEQNKPELFHYFISKLVDDNFRNIMGQNGRDHFLNNYTKDKFYSKFKNVFL